MQTCGEPLPAYFIFHDILCSRELTTLHGASQMNKDCDVNLNMVLRSVICVYAGDKYSHTEFSSIL